MKCINCNASIEDGSRFCNFCGFKQPASYTVIPKAIAESDNIFENKEWFEAHSSYENFAVEDGTKVIRSFSLHNNDGDYENNIIKKLHIPDSVEEIDDNAFMGCTAIESLTIPDSVNFIGNGAFYKCTSLKSITLPKSLILIGDDTFLDCTALKSITLPDVMSIGMCAFGNCRSLESVNIPNTVFKIGLGAFSECYNLTLTLHPELYIIGPQAFKGCRIKLPETYDKKAFTEEVLDGAIII